MKGGVTSLYFCLSHVKCRQVAVKYKATMSTLLFFFEYNNPRTTLLFSDWDTYDTQQIHNCP